MTTEAMKMIAQAKVTKAEERLKEVRAFSSNIEDVFKAVTAAGPLEEVEKKKIQVLGLGTDQGLCGSINSGLARHTQAVLGEYTDADSVELKAFGNRFLSNIASKEEVHGGISAYQKNLSFRGNLALCDYLLEEIPDQRRILFNRMVNMASFVVEEVDLPGRSALEQAEMGVYETEGVNEVLEDFYDFHFAAQFWRLLSEVEVN